MPLGDGTGPYGTGPRGSGRGFGRGLCNRYPSDFGGTNEKAYLQSMIARLEAQLNVYKKRLEELK